MYEIFSRTFVPDDGRAAVPIEGGADSWFSALVHGLGGRSFNRGLYRIVSPDDSTAWSERLAMAFPEFTDRLTCFGYDWLGRAFALDGRRQQEGEPAVLMLEP